MILASRLSTPSVVRLALWLACSACLAAPTSVAGQFTPFEAAIARFDAEIATGVAEDAAGAVSVAVFEGDRVVWSKGWGWADIEQRIAADARTIGRTGSISKTFTATLALQLHERGVIDLDDPVVDYLPEIRGLADPPVDPGAITFRQLASHTAGLVREPGLEGAATGPIQLWEERVLQSIPTTGFETQPGTEYSYSNIGFGILGLALSRAAGVPFIELVETLIFEPLAMDDSFFVLSDPRQIARMSVGYSRSRSGEVSAERATREHFGRGYKVPNGGIYSTVGDLARFAAALMGVSEVRILGDPGLLDMRTPQPPAARYGLGLSISDRDGGLRVIGHGGSVAGYNAYLAFDPLSRLGVAMLRTTDYEPPVVELLEELVATTVTGGLAPGEPITVPDFAFDEYLPDHFDPSVSAPVFVPAGPTATTTCCGVPFSGR